MWSVYLVSHNRQLLQDQNPNHILSYHSSFKHALQVTIILCKNNGYQKKTAKKRTHMHTRSQTLTLLAAWHRWHRRESSYNSTSLQWHCITWHDGHLPQQICRVSFNSQKRFTKQLITSNRQKSRRGVGRKWETGGRLSKEIRTIEQLQRRWHVLNLEDFTITLAVHNDRNNRTPNAATNSPNWPRVPTNWMRKYPGIPYKISHATTHPHLTFQWANNVVIYT